MLVLIIEVDDRRLEKICRRREQGLPTGHIIKPGDRLYTRQSSNRVFIDQCVPDGDIDQHHTRVRCRFSKGLFHHVNGFC